MASSEDYFIGDNRNERISKYVKIFLTIKNIRKYHIKQTAELIVSINRETLRLFPKIITVLIKEKNIYLPQNDYINIVAA